MLLSPSVDRIYQIISVNGVNIDMGECPIYLTIHVKYPSTISIPPSSIHHVTCPDGYLYPYRDGSFHVSLDDSVQNYAWILDIAGKVIRTERMLDQTFTIDVSDLASGIYMLRLVSTDGASKIVKFVNS